MVFEIRDFQSNALGLEGLLGDDDLRSQDRRDSFHTKYVEQVGALVGFRRSRQELTSFSNSDKRIFNRIYEEYQRDKDSHGNLSRWFGSYNRFFNAFFVAPYGVELRDGAYVDALPSPIEVPESAPLSVEQEKLKKKREIQCFVRRINLSALLYSCLCHERPSVSGSEDFTGKKLPYVKGKKKKELSLVADLPKSVWDIMFSETGDCLSIKVDREDKENTAVPVVKFGEYWFASMLHYLHPHIHYLLVNSVERAVGRALPRPLFRVKLMEAADSSGYQSLIVGGVMGESLAKFRGAGVEEFIKERITRFLGEVVGQSYVASNGLRSRKIIFYNETHLDKKEETCNQFVRYLRDTYVDKAENWETHSLFVTRSFAGDALESENDKGMWNLTVPGEMRDLASISNVDEAGNPLFSGEQYSETFYQSKKPGVPGAFTKLEGIVNGFFYYPPPEAAPSKPKKMSLAKRLAIGGLAVSGAIAGYLAFSGGGEGSGSSTDTSRPRQAYAETEDVAADGGDIADRVDAALPPTPLCSEVPPEPGWPAGTRIAKRLDFDGDGKSDIMVWREGEFKLDLSRLDGFGVWDMVAKYSDLPGKNFWPFVEDMDSDGREDFVLYVPDTGAWYVKFTRFPLRNEMPIDSWDLIIPDGVGSACKTHLDSDPTKSVYGRPLPGDYNGDGMVDLAVVCSDGFWRIDYGGSGCGAFGSIDEQVRFLDETRLAQAPGWAYLPVFDEVPGGRRVMAYKIPDTLPDAGRLVIVKAEGTDWSGVMPTLLGGNDTIIVPGRHAGPSSDMVSLMTPEGWKMLASDGRLIPVAGRDAFANCAPVLGDFDGDNVDDAAAYCGDDFRIIKSGGSNDPDGVTNIRLRTFREGEESEYSLPGVVYFGGASYRFVQQLMAQDRETHPGEPTPIPVDMMRVSVSVSSIVFEEDDNGTPFDFFIKQYGGGS